MYNPGYKLLGQGVQVRREKRINAMVIKVLKVVVKGEGRARGSAKVQGETWWGNEGETRDIVRKIKGGGEASRT